MQNFFGEILDFSPPFQIYKCYTLRKNICVKEDIPMYSRWNGKLEILMNGGQNMNLKKRGLALLMCICMIMTLLPVAAFADDAAVVYGQYTDDV